MNEDTMETPNGEPTSEATTDGNREQAFVDAIATYARQFDELCQERHNAGMVEYGKFTFLENDIIRMMMEELADTSNYCRMQFIKLMLLQEALGEELADKPEVSEDLGIGVGSFKGAGQVGWNRE